MKTIKTLSLLLLAVLLFAAWLHTPVEAAADPILLGDADGDGEVTSRDAALIARTVVGLATFDGDAAARADVNGDGSVGADDAARILRCFIGLTDDLA